MIQSDNSRVTMRVSQVEFTGIVANQVSLQRHPSVKEQRANDVRNED